MKQRTRIVVQIEEFFLQMHVFNLNTKYVALSFPVVVYLLLLSLRLDIMLHVIRFVSNYLRYRDQGKVIFVYHIKVVHYQELLLMHTIPFHRKYVSPKW